jgi:hypothetical protein
MSKNVDFIVEKMIQKPYIVLMGASKIGKWLGVSREEVLEARTIVKSRTSGEGYDVVEQSTKTLKMPNILLLDIETAPISAYVWSLWKQNVYIDQIISNWFMLTWSAKWLYSTEVMSDAITPEEVQLESDARIVYSLLQLLDKADVVIAHNGMAFDIPKINARAIVNGFAPPSPYQQIDTLMIARKQFGFSSNKLDALATVFGMPGKIKTDFKLWSDCMKGDQTALNQMETYNRQDVIVLEEVYLKLRPWTKGHINLGLYSDGDVQVCPNCGSTHIHEDVKFYYTPAGRYKTYRCECGAISRGRKNEVTSEERKNITISIAR